MSFKVIMALAITGLVNVINANGQPELQKVTPLSPNAASIAKYGETPVGYFTGVPNIGIPIYTIQSKELSLPISLSYHAGGNKVEDIASWVGTGWSIGTIPSISRAIRDKPDEYGTGYGGFFNTYDGLTVAKIADSAIFDVTFEGNYDLALYEGQTDSEADIYFYTLASKSGKFFWDQVAQQFHTTPWSNIKISRVGNDFKIIDDDGTIYSFAGLEMTEAVTNGASTISSWVVDKMYNANMTDSISFGYGIETHYTQTLTPSVKDIWGGCAQTHGIMTNTTIEARPVYTITFASGRIEFNTQLSGRQDLNGGYALDNVKIFNKNDLLIKRFDFTYSYRTSANGLDDICDNYASSYEKKRLFLDTIVEKNKESVPGQTYSFLYDSTINSPCRISQAQDYWGYYNGEGENENLVPTVATQTPGGYLEVQGADRNVYPEYSQFGLLKRIVYPTGGHTDFEYENNQGYNLTLPKTYVGWTAYLSGEDPPTTDTYIDTFVVNNPADFYLNDNLGGAFVNVDIGDLGCDISGGGQTCAQLFLRGLETSNSSINTTITYSFDGYHLPNGAYEMKAIFNQSPPEYESFYYIISGKRIDSAAMPLNQYIGGVRIKTIKNIDGLGGESIRKFKYTTKLDADTSSGDIFGSPYFVNFEDYYCTSSNQRTQAYRVISQNNATAVSHTGSFVGYKTVFEFIDSAKVSGVNEYNFLHWKDDISYGSPFPPTLSYEDFRGHLTQVNIYRKTQGHYYLVSQTSNEYHLQSFDSLTTYCIKARFIAEPTYNEGVYDLYPEYDKQMYTITPRWAAISKKTERTFNQNDDTKYLETITDYEYDTEHFQLVNTKFKNSKNQEIQVKNYYPADLSLSGGAEAARVALLDKNRVNVVLKQEQLNNNNPVKETNTNYKLFGNIIMPEEVFFKNGNGSSESRVKFLKYDTYGNLISQQKTNDITISYIWDYLQNYPVAECTNADSASIAYTSFEADGKGKWSYSSPSTIDNTTVTGKKIYELNGTNNITKSGLSSGTTYIVSYWTKNASAYSITGTISGYPVSGRTVNGWKYFEHRVTGQTIITISGTGSIDELRLYPAKSEMITYTYQPLVGITTQCDANNRVLYYEYDNFSRLVLIRDQDRNIVKKICYNYAGQPEYCSYYYNVAKSGNFTRNNCGTGYTGSTVTYTVTAGSYTSTISQDSADQMAQDDVDDNGQAYANSNGSCVPSIYAKLTYENYNYSYTDAVHADIVVRFYSDAACTTPISVSNLNVEYALEGFDGSSSFSDDHTLNNVSGTSVTIEYLAELSYDNGMIFRFKDFYLLPGSGYTAVFD